MATRRGFLVRSGTVLCAAALGALTKAEPHDEGALRKARSIALLRAKGVSVMEGLPEIETVAAVRIRSVDEIVQRATCLFAVAVAATANDAEPARKVLDLWRAGAALSPNERRFLEQKPLPETERVDFSWRFDAAVPLLWALGWLEALTFPSDQVDPNSLAGLFKYGPSRSLPHLRDASEILDQDDLVYRMHWALDEQRMGRPAKVADLNADVVQERHRALNWLVRYDDANWDDVTTDT